MQATFSKQKIRGTLKLLSIIVLILIELFAQTGLVNADSDLDQDRSLIHENINYFNTCGSASDSSSPSNSSGLITSGPIYIMGDSITALAKNTYQQKFSSSGWQPTVNGLVNRQIEGGVSPDGLTQIDQDKSIIAKSNAIVIALGTNGVTNPATTTKKQVQDTMGKLKSYDTQNAPIFWVNVMDSEYDAASQTTNTAIEDGVGSDGTVIDWYSTAKSKADYKNFNEGVHPVKQQDIETLVNLVYDSVTSASGAGSSDSAQSGDSGCCSSDQASSPSQVDLDSIVSKYHLQSAVAQKVGGEVVGSYNADKPPVTPASTMKLIIADTLLRSGISLSSHVEITSDMVYGSGYSAGDNPTLGEAMDQMLRVSSNTAANGLISALGGFSAITSKAQSYGYTNTDIKAYYSPAGDGVNKSTIGDEASAMNHIFTTDGLGYSQAQQDLNYASGNDNYYNVADDANKWAGTSQVAGNVAKLSASGSDYIVGVYINESDSEALSKGDIKKATADIAAAIKGSGGDSSSASDSSTSQCCSGSSTGTGVSGNISPAVGKGMSAAVQQKFQQIMVAAGQKSGVDPNFIATFYYIEDGLAGGDSTNNADSAQPPPRTGDGNWKEPPPPYGHGPAYPPPNSFSATGPFQFINSTWLQWGRDGNGDGKKDVNDLADAAFAAGAYLGASGAKNTTSDANLRRAAFAYNHSTTYGQSALNTFHYLTGKGSSTVSGSTGSDCSGSSAQPGTVAAAVAAAKLLDSMHVGYIWGGGHPAGEVTITDPSKLVAQGLDCSGSVAWVLYQAGLDPSLKNSGVGASTEMESWGEPGPGQELTIWANSAHAFLEFNVPGLGHYEMNTVNAEGGSTANTKTPNATGPGPRFFKVDSNGSPGSNTSGFTPRHFKGM